jgi:predicted TIM-barrel fold metal-dependent hydrolase
MSISYTEETESEPIPVPAAPRLAPLIQPDAATLAGAFAQEKIIDVHCGWGSTLAAPNWKDIEEVRGTLQKRKISLGCISSLLGRRYDLTAGNEAVANAVSDEPEAGDTDLRGWLVIHPARTAEVTEQMRRYLYSKRFVGAALYSDPLTGTPVTVSDAHDLLQAFRRFHKPLLVDTPNAAAMAEVVRIADEMSGIRVVASGMGGEEWREAIAMCAKPGNLFLDISGVLIPEKVEYAIEVLHGTRKLLFASGAPYTDPAAVLGLLDDLDLAADDRRRILYVNAERIFDLAPVVETPASLMPMDDNIIPNYLVGNEQTEEAGNG